MKKVFLALAVLCVLGSIPFNGAGAQAVGTIALLDRNNKPTASIVDGNQVSLKIELGQALASDAQVDFLLLGDDAPVATCSLRAGQRDCQTASFVTLGWFWNPDGSAALQREVTARVGGQPLGGSLSVSVSPRPVVMVHGFNADWHTWDKYLGAQGYLATLGLHGYAVGDGQVEGVMNTGSISAPTVRTNTIAQNAAILGQYIDNVQKATGAEKVDLLVHSMGGMISRYYLDRLMNNANVAQLIILGTPMAGSSCANLPAALGLMLPATIEIQPGYMVGIFNQQIYRRQGVPFHALAGTKLSDSVQSPCTPVPSDVVVTVDSVKAIPMPVQEMPLLHMDLNTAPEVFENFVAPLLKTAPGKFESPADPPAGSSAPALEQFTKAYTGHVNPGETQEVVINIDPGVTVANFAMFDTTRTLTTTVVGASGKQIQLDAEENGLIRVDDPSSMVYLGYGFKQPKPGKWVITVAATDATPPTGADFAITAQFSGGAILSAQTSALVPALHESVSVSAALTDEGAPLALTSAQARLTKPDGSVETVEMQMQANTAALTFQPDQAGIYGIEVSVTSKTSDGFDIDRAVNVAVEVQPSEQSVALKNYLLALALALAIALLLRGLFRLLTRKRRQST